MHNKRVYNIKIAIDRLKNYCALQDRCQNDITKKMKEWGLLETTQTQILDILIIEKYVDEERYAKSFSRGKFQIKKWGKVKISSELRKKKISEKIITIGINEIEESDYLDTLDKLLLKKKNSIKDKNLFIKKRKIADFLFQRGFESDLVWNKLRRLKD